MGAAHTVAQLYLTANAMGGTVCVCDAIPSGGATTISETLISAVCVSIT